MIVLHQSLFYNFSNVFLKTYIKVPLYIYYGKFFAKSWGDMNISEDSYLYCTTHKKCLLPEDITSHVDTACELVVKQYQIHQRIKIKKLWMAKTIVKKEGMHIYTPPPIPKPQRINTLPKDAVILDVGLPFKRLGP